MNQFGKKKRFTWVKSTVSGQIKGLKLAGLSCKFSSNFVAMRTLLTSVIERCNSTAPGNMYM